MEAVIVGVLSLIGTLGGSLFGILAANKLTNYRIEQLEKKVEQHNNFVEKIIVIEQSQKAQWKKIDDITATIEELKKEVYEHDS